MLAYVSWHRAAAGVEQASYERALERFHRSLARQPPAGFHESISFRVGELPWLPAGDGQSYEDWYLLADWSAVGVLEEAAVSHGHASLHDRVAAHAAISIGAIYRLTEGSPRLAGAQLAIWVARPAGHERPSLAALLGDGLDPERGGLWRRCLGLGPAPELCLLSAEAPAGVAATRLPDGWRTLSVAHEALWHD